MLKRLTAMAISFVMVFSYFAPAAYALEDMPIVVTGESVMETTEEPETPSEEPIAETPQTQQEETESEDTSTDTEPPAEETEETTVEDEQIFDVEDVFEDEQVSEDETESEEQGTSAPETETDLTIEDETKPEPKSETEVKLVPENNNQQTDTEETVVTRSVAKKAAAVTASLPDNAVKAGNIGTNLEYIIYDNTLNGEGQEYWLEISTIDGGPGIMPDFTSTNTPWNAYKSKLVGVSFYGNVTNIGAYAFDGFTALTYSGITKYITSIGNYAFRNTAVNDLYYIDGIKYIGNNAFENSKIQFMHFPESILTIGNEAFKNCTSLTEVTVSSKIDSFGDKVFNGCTSLESIKFYSAPPTRISMNAFFGSGDITVYYPDFEDSWINFVKNYYGNSKLIFEPYCNYLYKGTFTNGLSWVITTDYILGISGDAEILDQTYQSLWNNYKDKVKKVYIKDGVTDIGDYAFYGFSQLEEVRIPFTVNGIGKYAFSDCSKLKTINYPYYTSGIKTIDKGAFYRCVALETLDLPDRLTTIGNNAFYNCTALKSIDLPDNLTTIGEYAFQYCESLETLTIPSKVTVISANAFDYCKNLKSVTLNEGLTSIGESAFNYCYALETINIPESVVSIGSNAFGRNRSLKTITLPASITKISDYTFYYCDGLTTINVPDSITDIGYAAFNTCTSLKNVNYTGSKSQWNKISIDTNYNENLLNATVHYGKYDISVSDSKNGEISVNKTTAAKGETVTVTATPDNEYRLDKIYVNGYGISGNTFTATEDCIVTAEFISVFGPVVEGECGDSAEWALYDTDSDGTGDRLVISGSGETYTFDTSIGGNEIPWSIYSDDIESIVVEEGITNLGSSIFEYHSGLKEVELPESLLIIGDYAFYDCISLESIVIPSKVQFIGYCVFTGCKVLTEVVLPSNLNKMYYYAFGECDSLESIIIPEGTTDIGQYTFYGCDNLKEIQIPESVTNIGDSVFYKCDAFQNIYYTGTEEQWRGINIGERNSVLDSVTVYYNYCPYEHTWVDATCIKAKHCSVCNYTVGTVESHTETVDKAKEPTCTETGLTEGKHCSVCNKVLVAQQTVDALGHTEITDKAVAPDCENTGLTEGKHCSVCDKVLVAQKTVDAIGHTEVTDKAVAPDCENTGLTEGKHCSVCDKVLVAQKTVDALGHTEVTDKAVEPTCIATGLTEGSHCSVCEKVFVEQQVVPRVGHTVETYTPNGDGTKTGECTVCKEILTEKEITASGDCGEVVTWQLWDSNSDGTGETLIISGTGEMDNYSYSNNAPWYEYRESITKIIVENGIISIGKYAFYNLSVLKTIELPVSVKTVKDYAFRDTSRLEKVYYDGTYSEWKSIVYGDNYYLYNAKVYCVCNISVTQPQNGHIYVDKYIAYTDDIIAVSVVPAEGYSLCKLYVDGRELFENTFTVSQNHTVTAEFVEKDNVLDSGNIGEHDYDNDVAMDNVKWTLYGDGRVVISGTGEMYDCYWYESPLYKWRGIIKSIEIQEGVTTVSGGLLEDAPLLEKVYYPDSMEMGYYNYHVFNNCPQLKTAGTVGSGANIEVAWTDKVPKYAFLGMDSLEEFVIPEGITTIENHALFSCNNLEKLVVPASVTTFGNVFDYELNKLKTAGPAGGGYNYEFSWTDSIPQGAFSGMDSLEEVVLPDTVRRLENKIFEGCDNLKSVKLPQNKYFDRIPAEAFSGCRSLTNITIPDSVKKLEHRAFGNCTSLENLIIPESVILIENYMFEGCTSIKKMIIPDSVTSIGWDLFEGCTSLESVVLSKNLTSIGNSAFYNCTSLKNVAIPDGMRSIGSTMFYNCSSLESIELPESITSIDYKAFYGCSSLKEVKIKGNIYSIGEGAFYDCKALESIKFPVTLNSINQDAFYGCYALKDVYYPSGYNWNNIKIGLGNIPLEEATIHFEHDWGYEIRDYYNGETEEKVAYITGKANISDELIVPSEIDGLKVLGFAYKKYDSDLERSIGTFENNKIIKTVVIPGTVEQIPLYIFKDCTNLEKIVISEGVEAIREYAFAGCTSVKEITVPSTISWWYNNAFTGIPKTAVIIVAEDSGMDYVFKDMGFQNVIVNVILKGISIKDITMVIGNEYANLPTVKKIPEKATDELDIVWSIEDISVAELADINDVQKIRAVSVGTTTITAFDKNSGKTATAKIDVVLPNNVNMALTVDTPIETSGMQTGEERVIKSEYRFNGEEHTIPNDKLTYTSSNPKAVTVDENGVITSVCTSATPVTVTITATLKNDAAEKAIFKVKAVTKQASEVPVEIGTVESVNGYNAEIVEAENNNYTVTVPYEMVKNAPLSFEVSGAFDDAEFEAVGAKAPGVSWSTDNKAVASVKALSASEGYKAQITVAKGANGTAIVTVTAKDINKASAVIEIDVRDYTPRLSTNTVTLNSYKTEGAEIKLYQAYDAEIKAEGEIPAVQIKGDDRFSAEYNAETETVTVKANETVANNSKGYKVTLAVNTSKGLYEQTVTVKVANKLPTVTVKQNGVFNTFYKDSSVFAAVTAKDAQIADVQLKDTNTFAGVYNPADGGVNIRYADDYEGITPDTSATLEVSFEGYRETAKVKYNISAKEIKPNLVLSRSSTVFTYLSMDSEAVTVKDKATGEVFAVTADNWKVVSDSEAYATAEKAENGIKFAPILNADNKFANNKTSHTVKFEVQAENWAKPLTFSHTLTVNTSKPTVSTKNSTVILRTMYESSGEMQFTANIANCPVPVFEYESTSTNDAVKAEAEKIVFVQNGWKVTASVDTSNLPKAGTYSYRVTPTVKDTQNNEVELKAVTVKVTVSDTKPTVSIRPGTLTLNGAVVYSATAEVTANDAVCPEPVRYVIEADTTNAAAKAEMEKIELSCDGWQITAQFKDINDMPKNGSYRYRVKTVVPSISGETELKTAYVVVKVNTANPKVTLAKTGVTVNPQIGENISFEAKINTGYVIEDMQFDTANSNAAGKAEVSYSNGKVTVKAIDSSLANGTYSYSVKASVRADKDGAVAKEISVGTLKVTVKSGKATLRTTQSGSMDLVMRDKGITYTVTGGSNFNYANVDMTQVRNVNLTGADAEQFRVLDVSVNSKNQLKVHIVPKAEAQLEANRTYRYGFAVEADNMVIESSVYSVKTKQSALQIKTAGDTTVYQSRTSGQIEIGVKAPAGAKIAEVEIISTGTTVPKGAVEFTARENGNGTYTVDYTVTKATKLKAGKTYRLALKVTPEGNATNKAPQTVYATLNVKR